MSNQVEAVVRKILKENVKSSINFDELGVDQSLSDIGFNSVDFVKVAVGMESEFEFELGDDELNFSQFDSIKIIVEFVERKKSELNTIL